MFMLSVYVTVLMFRYVDLLMNVGLEKEIVDIDFIPKSLDIDFKMVKDNLVVYKEQSQSFLAHCFS